MPVLLLKCSVPLWAGASLLAVKELMFYCTHPVPEPPLVSLQQTLASPVFPQYIGQRDCADWS